MADTEVSTEIVETTAATTEQVKQETYVVTVRRNYYADVLERLYYYDRLPNDGDDIEAKMAGDYETYAVYDVDGDGIEELMLIINRPVEGLFREYVLEYDVDNDLL